MKSNDKVEQLRVTNILRNSGTRILFKKTRCKHEMTRRTKTVPRKCKNEHQIRLYSFQWQIFLITEIRKKYSIFHSEKKFLHFSLLRKFDTIADDVPSKDKWQIAKKIGS